MDRSRLTYRVLQNSPYETEPTIRITEFDEEWEEAFKNYFYSTGTPTKSPEWKSGIFFHYEKLIGPELAPLDWSGSYWKEGSSVYDFWLKKIDCQKCKALRTKAICYNCIEIARAKENEKMIDVLSPQENEVSTAPVVDGKTFEMIGECSNALHEFFWQFTKMIRFMDMAMRKHGAQLHTPGCAQCIVEQKAWLETNHSDWREKTKETDHCDLCLGRAYKALKDVSPTKKEEEVIPASKRSSLSMADNGITVSLSN